jgi:uncharacterized protein (DUF58 family)
MSAEAMSAAPDTEGARAPASRGLLPAELLARLERLRLRSRRPVRGWAAGDRKGRRPGRSVEFHDYRAYGVGDDLRYVDWNIYARTDRLHVKLFVDDEELCLHLLLDASASMDWGTPSKLEWAARLAAALGFVGLASLERVGVGILRSRFAEGWPPARGRGRITALFDFLAGLEAGGTTDLGEALTGYAARAQDGSVAVLVSDLLDPRGYEAGLGALLERGCEVHVVHVLSRDELEPDLAGELRLIDHETGEARPLSVSRATVRAYQERLQRFIEGAEAFCHRHAIPYHRATSDAPVESLVLGRLRGTLLA